MDSLNQVNAGQPPQGMFVLAKVRDVAEEAAPHCSGLKHPSIRQSTSGIQTSIYFSLFYKNCESAVLSPGALRARLLSGQPRHPQGQMPPRMTAPVRWTTSRRSCRTSVSRWKRWIYRRKRFRSELRWTGRRRSATASASISRSLLRGLWQELSASSGRICQKTLAIVVNECCK
jgi:hypothetical protein